MTIRKDFSKTIYEKRIAVIEGEEIDVSRISTRVMLNLVDLKERREELEAGGKEIFYKLIEIIAQCCKSNSKITVDWLIDNTEIMQLLDLMEFIVEPLLMRADIGVRAEKEVLKDLKNLKTPLKENQKSLKK